ncbi:MAG: DUF1801 domain-containing protein [Bacteroidetes bacterium]|nr:MAG: DUF1801 domain-containing protein [Bacteroidota bacterium]
MRIEAISPEAYLEKVPEDRKEALGHLRDLLCQNLPAGFEETISYSMITYVVPHSLYPAGYHCDVSQPLPFISIASQKNFIALYHMGLYAMPHVLAWFVEEYPKHSKRKLDMGKSCIRFKKPEDIPFALIAELATKITVADWVECYERNLRR